jgi:hypothetical protein
MKEEWKTYPNDSRYKLSNYGKVFDTKIGREVGWIKGSGYKNTQGGLVHRMVLETFVGPFPIDKPYTNHIDGNKLNNRLDNLEFTNHSLNGIHCHQTGLNKQSVPILVYRRGTNEFIGEYYSIGDAAFQLLGNRNTGNIGKVLSGKIKSAYGYIWVYKKTPLD